MGKKGLQFLKILISFDKLYQKRGPGLKFGVARFTLYTMHTLSAVHNGPVYAGVPIAFVAPMTIFVSIKHQFRTAGVLRVQHVHPRMQWLHWLAPMTIFCQLNTILGQRVSYGCNGCILGFTKMHPQRVHPRVHPRVQRVHFR